MFTNRSYMAKNNIDLAHLGIALRCPCGADMNADAAHILFADGGRIQISGRIVRCFVCGARFKPGEWLSYKIDFGPIPAKDRRDQLMDIRSSHER